MSDAPMTGVLLLRAKKLADQSPKARGTLMCAPGQKTGLCDLNVSRRQRVQQPIRFMYDSVFMYLSVFLKSVNNEKQKW